MSKKYPSTEELENPKHQEQHDPADTGHQQDPGAPSEFHPIGNPSKDREIKPDPWDNQEFYDKVRAAGFPGSPYGDAAFMAACYNLSMSVQPPPPDPEPPLSEKKHAH